VSLPAPSAPSAGEILRADLGAADRTSTRWLIRLVLLVARPWLTVVGGEHLAGLREPAIFALNHNNSIETIVVPAALFFLRRGRPIAFVVDWMFLRIPLVGWLLGHGHPIPVYTKRARWGLLDGTRRRRAAAAESVLERCRRRLAGGQSVGIFPEGTRNRSAERLGPGRIGLGHLALATGCPVVPVGIDFPAGKRLGRVPRVGRLRVRIGAPLHFDVPAPGAAPGRADRATRQRARTVVATVLDRLGALCGKEPPRRPSVPRSTSTRKARA